MHPTIPSLVFAFSFCCSNLAFAQDIASSRIERIQSAVKAVVALQNAEGEAAVVAAIQACYASQPDANKLEKLEECISQDIAYANFSAGMYRHVLKNIKQPEYLSMDALKKRVYAQSMQAGMSASFADQFLRRLAPEAIQALVPAIDALSSK
ncbi:hypothetical protein [Paucibacter sp. DJ1R-11]|uniref:hypothetical protein n=1 Tax=Paucibacter sp. DJ1R-11 TaxID=2893556 RepID=UPI0021E3FF84|nr:hypothetical protein [Paucibacter sp. DJ1R-11]